VAVTRHLKYCISRSILPVSDSPLSVAPTRHLPPGAATRHLKRVSSIQPSIQSSVSHPNRYSLTAYRYPLPTTPSCLPLSCT